jgi:integrase
MTDTGVKMPHKISDWNPVHLTDAIVKQQPPPTQPNRLRRDTTEIGLALCVTRNGSKSFVLNYTTRGGRERRYTIGRVSDWSTVAARQEARRLNQLIDQGSDPLADVEEKRAAPTMNELADRFVAEHLPRKRPMTADAYKRILDLHVRPHFGLHLKVNDVRFEDCDALHRAVSKRGGPYIANRTIAVLSKMFSLACRWHMRSDNPAKGIERNPEAKRKRYLSGDELRRLLKALKDHSDQQSANVVRLALLTGRRRGEILGARWADIDLGTGVWTAPGSTTKQRTDHSAPISAPARQLLSEIREQQLSKRRTLGEFVFPSPGSDSGHQVTVKKSWAALCRAAGIAELRFHDLRHSFASTLASGGASLPLIGQLLGHSNPLTTHRYAHLFDDPQRAAVEKVGAIITAATKDAPPAQPILLKSPK